MELDLTNSLHPEVQHIKDTLEIHNITYLELSLESRIGLSKIKKKLSGKQQITLKDKDRLSLAMYKLINNQRVNNLKKSKG